jgi:hypothetical protein
MIWSSERSAAICIPGNRSRIMLTFMAFAQKSSIIIFVLEFKNRGIKFGLNLKEIVNYRES